MDRNLESNDLNSTIPESLGNLTQLTHLKQLTLPETIGDMTNLEKMLAYGTRLSGTIPRA